MAYLFYLDTILLPVTPSSLDIKINGGNKTVSLINGGEINIIKDNRLTEYSFKFIVPAVKYPFAASEAKEPKHYLDELERLKNSDKPFFFKALMDLPGSRKLFDINTEVTLESYDIDLDAGNGFDIVVSVKLKKYRRYAIKKLIPIPVTATPAGTVQLLPQTTELRPQKEPEKTYTIKQGDTLYNIARQQLGNGSKWTEIYSLNKDIIEAAAKKYGRSSSSNGHWIYPGCTLKLPKGA